MLCKHCNTENEEGNTVCKSCGQPLETEDTEELEDIGVSRGRFISTVILIIIGALVLICVVALVFWLVFRNPEENTAVVTTTSTATTQNAQTDQANQIYCPQLIGESYNEIVNDVGNLKIVVAEYAYNEDYDVGVIYAQSPQMGETIMSDGTVNVYVSLGSAYNTTTGVAQENTTGVAVMADYRGMTREEAEQDLMDKGVTIRVSELVTDEVAPGCIVKSYPAAGQEIEPGDLVILYMRPSEEKVTVPELTGLQLVDAIAAINNAGLKVGNPEVIRKSGYSPGVVVAQRIAAGTQVDVGTEIILQINAYDMTTTAPPQNSTQPTE